MPQVSTNEISQLFQSARSAVRKSRETSREAARSLARLQEELERRGIDVSVEDNDHGPAGPKGDA